MLSVQPDRFESLPRTTPSRKDFTENRNYGQPGADSNRIHWDDDIFSAVSAIDVGEAQITAAALSPFEMLFVYYNFRQTHEYLFCQ